MFLYFILAIVIILLLYVKNYQPLNILFGIYRQNAKFYYLKLLAMFVVLSVRKRKAGDIEDVDKPQPLSENPLAIDAVYFNGSSKDKCILAFGTAQRKLGRVNGFCILKVPQYSDHVLVSPKFPNTSLDQAIEEQNDSASYSVEGISLSPVVPMKSWKLKYEGKMKFENDSKAKLVDVKIDANWTTNLPAFNYDVDIHPITIARAIAMEPWSREYFENLEHFHQTHYEQYGDVRGTATINGKDYPIFTNSVRDHSFAEMRDWKNFHRYVMHFFNLENGDRISVGVISIPVTFASIEVGFITKSKEYKNVPITSCDLKLFQHGEAGNPPKDYAFNFWAGKKQYTVQVQAEKTLEFYIGEQAESRVVELYSKFTVNGISGWGVAEWQYRNVNGLPQ